MPESPVPTSPEEPAGRRMFSTAFRGFDQAEVRAYLAVVAAEFETLNERVADLQAQLEQARRPAERQAVDVASLTAALGEETGNVLRVAQEAAEELRTRAEEGAARTLREAHDEALRIRASAEAVLGERTAIADQEAAKVRGAAEEDAARARNAATAEAEATVSAAIATGKDMVGQAQAARERVLADLAKRRNIALNQLEALRVGRERLLTSFGGARAELDQIVDDLTQADEEARKAAELIGRSRSSAPAAPAQAPSDVAPEPGPDVAPKPAVSPEPLSSPEPAVAEAVVSDPVVAAPEAAVSEPVVAEPEPVVAEPADAQAAVSEPAVAEPVVAEPVVAEPAVGVEAGDERGGGIAGPGPAAPEAMVKPVPEPVVAEPEPISSPTPEPESPPEAVDPPVVEAAVPATEVSAELDTAPAESEDAEPDAPAPRPAPYPHDPVPAAVFTGPPVGGPPPGGRVDRLFAQIRLDQATTLVEEAPAVAAPTSEIEPTDEDTALEAPRTDGDESYLQQRDVLVEVAQATTGRALKRALADDQNGALERLRTLRVDTVDVEVVLESEQAQLRSWARRAMPGLVDAAAAGARLADGNPPADLATVAAIGERLAVAAVGPLRQRLGEMLEKVGGDRGGDTIDRINGVFRDTRGRLERLVGDAVTEAASAGFVAAVEPGVTVRWVVQDTDGPCPDCDDNALAGAVVVGEAFPTGQAVPPAHSGCRCVLIRATT